MKLKVLDLFGGIGGFSLGLERTGGFETVAFCEIDPFCQKILKKHWSGVPIFNDVRNLEYDGAVDVITGGFPCQDISLANSGKMSGLGGKKSSLWFDYLSQICRHNPSFIIIENSPVLRTKGLEQILDGLSKIGYDAEWHCIPATAVDAPHSRDRVWIIAYPVGFGDRLPEGQILSRRHFLEHVHRWPRESGIRRICNGVPGRVDRLKALGNAVVPHIPEMIGHAILQTQEKPHD